MFALQTVCAAVIKSNTWFKNHPKQWKEQKMSSNWFIYFSEKLCICLKHVIASKKDSVRYVIVYPLPEVIQDIIRCASRIASNTIKITVLWQST
jgi:hypothetical protein